MNDNLPPIIEDMVLALNNASLSTHIRKNFRDTLDAIVRVCSESISKFDKEDRWKNKQKSPGAKYK